mmetsp:Transcript_7517/g.20838  ORF Transcript_7517/g.20838 Transcript_7517/m.20838 type:complete len:673 (-) Transcript_7517:313-2331(-)
MRRLLSCLVAVAVCAGYPVALALSGHSSMPSSSSLAQQHRNPSSPRVIPITVLSGFLGSGKTTLLQHLLENKQGLKIGVVINDMASINVDAKLLQTHNNNHDDASPSSSAQPDGMVQFANGCACCEKSQELLTSLSELLTVSDLRANHNPDDQFDHIVVELSGIADPRAVRANWQQAQYEQQLFLTERLRLDTLVTVVDCSIVFDYMVGNQSGQTANLEEAPQLFYRNAREQEEAQQIRKELMEFQNDDSDWISDSLWSALQNVNDPHEESTSSIASLLTSQIETADVILLNKCDLAQEVASIAMDDPSDTQTQQRKQPILSRIKGLISALSGGRATVYETVYGRVSRLEDILATAQGQGVVLAGPVDDHQDAVQFHEATATGRSETNSRHSSTASSHSHSHSHSSTDSSHSHSHDHSSTGSSYSQHSHDHAAPLEKCDDLDCSSPTHSRENVTDSSHSHSHDHAASLASCDDPNCTDPSHNHEYVRNHPLDIQSIVYNARRPFHPTRLASFVSSRLSVTRGLPLLPRLDKVPRSSSIMRSKGFCWLANSHRAATYWSHAGKSFELTVFGSWWATLPRSLWPPDLVETILIDFDHRDHDEDKNSDNTSVGDRRQSLVLIGVGLQNEQQDIFDSLNNCLLTDSEWDEFRQHRHSEQELASRFPSPFTAKSVEL